MSQRKVILETLKSELKEKIISSNNYNSDLAEVRWGVSVFEEFTSKPAISFWCFNDTSAGQFADRDDRELNIYIYGFADTDGYTSDAIHDLLDDVLYFLQNDFSFKEDVYVGNVVVYEGGVSDPALVFELTIKIKYDRIIAVI
jgi:hypothetical protein